MTTTAAQSHPAAAPEKWSPHSKAGDVNKLMDELLARARHNRALFEREWFQEILFYSGHQWIIFDRQRGQWRMKRGPKWFPRPVTNRIAEHVDDNISALTRNPPDLSWLPTDDDPKSIAAADVADRIDEVIAEETGRFRNARLKAGWAVITGDCFIETGYDKSWDYGSTMVQYFECQDCGWSGPPTEVQDAGQKCPSCGSDNLMKAMERVGLECPQCGQFPYDEALAFQPCPLCSEAATMAEPAINMMTGQPVQTPPAPVAPLRPIYGETPIGTVEPKGKLWERVRSPFEVFYDLRTVREFSKEGGLRWVIIVELMDADEQKKQYPGLNLQEMSAAEGQGASMSMQYLESISMLAGVLDPVSATLTPGPRGGSEGPRVLREVLYHLPTEEYPEGLTAIRFNGMVVAEVKPLAYHDSDGNCFVPVTHIPFKKQPGRVPGRTFVSDIIPLNRTRNESEAMMMLSERRMANPVWVIPEGVVDRDPSGDPGEVVRYKHLSAGSGRAPIPSRIPGVEPPIYFERRLQNLDGQMERLAGSFAVAHGEAPKGITAASALALLGERQERAVSPQIQSWEQATETLARQQMYIFKEYATEERLRPVRDSVSKWSFESWSNANLGGNITVKVESGSAIPKSSAQMRATIEALLRIPGFLQLQDPEIARRIHQLMGTTTLIQHQEIDMRDAEQENDLFYRQWTGEPGARRKNFRMRIDNHIYHAAADIKFAKGDKFRQIEDAAQQGDPMALALVAEFMGNLEAHLAALAPPPMPEEGPGAGRPEGTGKVFSAGRQDVPATERPIMEPGSSAQDGLR